MNDARVGLPAEDLQEIRAHMGRIPAWRSHCLEWVDCTGSTNEDLKAGWSMAPCPMRFRIAGYQTAGRGQRGRVWTSAPGTGLLFSFTWIWQELDTAWEIPLRAGLATRAALLPFVGPGHRLWLKWPNDICLDDGKLGGILVESTIRGDSLCLVVGIGINLRMPGSLNEDATGPGMRPAELAEGGAPERAGDRLGILREFVTAWADQMCREGPSAPDVLRTAYIEAAEPFWGRNVRILLGDGAIAEGCAVTLAGNGALEIREKNGGHRLVRDARRLILAD